MQVARIQHKRIVAIVVAVVVLGVLFVATSLYTDRPQFCQTCHEMGPFYDAWTQGPHAENSCIDCHIEPGLTNRFTHKFVALQEVYAHFFERPLLFPQYGVVVPSGRCTRCHPDLASVDKGAFTHASHAEQNLMCADCHASTGHAVTYDALQAAGILDSAQRVEGQTVIGKLPSGSAAVGQGTAMVGHKKVACSQCHQTATIQCGTCHPTPASHFGADCRACHKPTVAFKDTVFDHPRVGEEHTARSFPCADCHPDGFSTSSCVKCHKGGVPSGD